jgi:predicted CxxxxCH...CXXCH cytochrome family protein
MNGPIKNALLTLLLVTIVTVTAQAQYLPPSHDFGQQSCGACHATGTNITNAANNNVCLVCHKVGSASTTNKQFFVGDMANPFGTTIESNDNTNYTHSSHEWSATDDNPAAGALPPVHAEMNTINSYNGSLSCNRCHSIHNTINIQPHLLRLPVTNDELCLDCHRLRNTNSHVYGSHPVNVDYNTAVTNNPTKFAAAPVNSNPSNPSSQMALRNGKVVCTTCHNVHFTDSSSKTLDNFSTAQVNGLLPSKGFLLRTDYRYANYTTLNSPNICTNCHAAKHEHNGGGQRVRCTDCHSGHVDYDPFATDAATMVPNVYMIKRYMNWSSASGWKDNKKLLPPKPTLFQDASVNRLYKRGDGKGVCQGCHDVPPEGTIAPSGNPYPGAHNIVDAKASDCNSCHTHEGQWSFGTSCVVCHGQPPTATTAAAGYPRSEANSAHTTHYSYGYKCLECHYNGAPLALHNTGGFQDVFPNPGYVPALAAKLGSAPSYDGTAYTCSAVYCHSNGAPATAYKSYSVAYRTTPTWFNLKTTCDSCHEASPTTNAHGAHLAKGYVCENCHSVTAIGSQAIKDKTKHADGNKQVVFASLSLPFPLAGTSCSTVYCHSDGKNNFSNPSWTNPASGKCGTCHETSTRSTGAHQAHLSTSVLYGPQFNKNYTVTDACNTCHGPDYTVKHLNGTTNDVDYNRCSTSCHANLLGSANWTTGRTGITCESCHTGTLSSIYGATAPDKSLAATYGHNKNSSSTGVIMNYNCTSCHDANAKHIDPAVHDTRLLPQFSGAINTECNACHNDTVKVPTATKSQMLTHVTAFIGTSATANTAPSACAACHDPHGTNNRSMIRAKIAFNNITYNISYKNTTSLVSGVPVGGLYTGLCQVCHTGLKYYNNNAASSHNAGTNCLRCHKHQSDPAKPTYYAFQPGGGDCSGCHGYPPVQTVQAGYGVIGNYSGARLQNYSGGGGAHDVPGHVAAGARPSQYFDNCDNCHYGANPSGIQHMSGDLTRPSTINVQVNPKYKFDSKLPITYTGNQSDNRSTYYSGTCSNVSCHFQASPKWSNQK